jgi:hypothetical protein
MFRTQYTPDFFVAEYYGLRNTIYLLGVLGSLSPEMKPEVYFMKILPKLTTFQG